MKPITYLSDQNSDYVTAVSKASTLEELISALDDFYELAPDARAAAPKNEEEFAEFKRGQAREQRGNFAGQEWYDRYSAILLPSLLVHVQLVVVQYMVPWGTAFLRLKEEGKIVKENGVYVWNDKEGEIMMYEEQHK